MSDNLRVSQIRLDPKATGGATSREAVTGWGLIQLYLGGLSQRGLVHSHTNHNSEARARKWSDTIGNLGAVDAWDWKAVTSASRRLNARIRRHAVSKVGSRPVLEGAFRLMESHPALLNW
jgi:hypothetical protein